MNIFKLVVDAYQLSEKDAKELFKCDDLLFKKILDGNEKPSLDGIYNLSQKYGITLDLIMKPEKANKKDQAILDDLNLRIKKIKMSKAEDEFYKKLLKNKITCISRNKITDIYDSENNKINIAGVIVKDNYELYKFVKSLGLDVKPGGYKINPLEEYSKGNIIDSWDKAENTVFSLSKSGILKDKGFKNMVLDLNIGGLSVEEANEILKKYQNGTIAFNPRHVLVLINNGAYVQRFAGTTIDNAGFAVDHWEKDVFQTLLLKKYCEDNI